MIPALLLYNPRAGRRLWADRALERVLPGLERRGIRARPLAVGTPGAQVESAARGSSLVIVYGGDGTLHHLLNRLLEWDLPVGILPGGTVNVLARQVGIPAGLEEALDVLSSPRRQSLYPGQGGDHYFHLMTGLGLDGDVVRRLEPGLKRVAGRWAYVWAAMVSLLRYPFPPFTLDLDGRRCRGTFAVVSRSSCYGGWFKIAPRASLQGRQLDVCLFTSRNPGRFLGYLIGARSGRHIYYDDVIYQQAERVRLLSRRPIPAQMDGEAIDPAPEEYRVSPRSLRLIVP